LKVKNKKILITGSNRGMGKGFALEAEKRGALLILHARKWTAEFKTEFLHPDHHQFIEADLGSPSQVSNFLEQLPEVDIVINNAGILTGELAEDQTYEQIENVMTINSIIPMKIVKAVLPKLVAKNAGMIVNNTSVSAIMRFPMASTYAASKAALAAYSECLRAELKSTDVKVLTLYTPGIKTDMFDDLSVRYGKKMDLKMMSSITIEEYAVMVLDAIESGKAVLRPKGSSGFGLWLAQHFPSLFSRLANQYFKR